MPNAVKELSLHSISHTFHIDCISYSNITLDLVLFLLFFFFFAVVVLLYIFGVKCYGNPD